ncbi:MAG: asparagine synthase (glutamine-hydrolyzing) [Deltaproteobacteria bacterium]
MCGIVGWIDWKTNLKEHRDTILKMTRLLSHRGPDNEGIWISEYALIGHRRLTVVDPEGGSQPMIKDISNNKYIITYNGELYNTNELRNELIEKGYRFISKSDTEVLLVSYIEWKEGCVDKLNGIYAFGVWDNNNQTMFLARDRAGVKPLFYTIVPNGLIFASEIKSILAHPEMKAEIDINGISELLLIGPARTPGYAVFKNIHELKPGYSMTFNKNGIKINKYWDLTNKVHIDDIPTTIIALKELLKNAITRQLTADVPVCTFLSGGLDSSAITAVAANEFNKNGNQLHTFSINYKDNNKYFSPNSFEPDSDEIWIETVSKIYGTQHHYITIDTPQLYAALDDALFARDLPGMADIDSSLLLFCKEVKKHATVALSGECADEIFGGYPWFTNDELINSDTFPWSRNIVLRKNLMVPYLREKIDIYEYIEARYKETLDEIPKTVGEEPGEAKMKQIFYLNLKWFMTTLLDRKDRMSMATGLEVRVPFCDHRLMEYVWNIPWKIKYLNNREKGLLRESLKGYLPNSIIERKKSPYPKTHNPSYLKAVSDALKSILEDTSMPIHSLVDKGYLLNMLNNDISKTASPWFGQLMNIPQLYAYIIQINQWLLKYKVKIII